MYNYVSCIHFVLSLVIHDINIPTMYIWADKVTEYTKYVKSLNNNFSSVVFGLSIKILPTIIVKFHTTIEIIILIYN